MDKDRLKDFLTDFLDHFVLGVNNKLAPHVDLTVRVSEQFVDTWVDKFWRENNDD